MGPINQSIKKVWLIGKILLSGTRSLERWLTKAYLKTIHDELVLDFSDYLMCSYVYDFLSLTKLRPRCFQISLIRLKLWHKC